MSSFFLREDLEADAVESGGVVSVVGAEAKHAVTVNRIRVGETVSIGNGRGLVATGPVVRADAGELVIEASVVENVQAPSPRLVLAQALAKGDRDELGVQAATELGVDAVIPWLARRSVSRWEGQKVAKGRERWASIVREATKQSIRAWLPVVAGLHSTAQLAALAADAHLLVLDPAADLAITEFAFERDDRDIVLVVGPEGGIAPAELDAFAAAGAARVRLGGTVLRTSTAGPAAISVLNVRLARW
ncbi:16S rRNA (uracil(1498)-N(3))-methyltransferase [Luethyella okanaganae]|uniref:Ribosomal RNA small subunit methyltransferase E n=1 Tax=Luethyella okanaganae TaxID=69372 RepID=A0ABW1VCJ3_9MICO